MKKRIKQLEGELKSALESLSASTEQLADVEKQQAKNLAGLEPQAVAEEKEKNRVLRSMVDELKLQLPRN
eukprot:3106036-Pleurochrysis_carterae.AAC.1